MMPEPAKPIESLLEDPRFPSGPWAGYYLQLGRRHRQDLTLTFRRGRLTGWGTDGIGRFAIRGDYDPESLEVTWTKSYATHSVWHRGFREIKGIWGTWEIACDGFRGGFHIWPKGDETGEKKRRRIISAETSLGVIHLPDASPAPR